MKELIDHALNIAQLKWARYADIRITDRREQVVSVKNGNVDGLGDQHSQGFGIRVLVNNSWGFASSSYLSKSEIERVTTLAVQIAIRHLLTSIPLLFRWRRNWICSLRPMRSCGGIQE
jgi:TldD protein